MIATDFSDNVALDDLRFENEPGSSLRLLALEDFAGDPVLSFEDLPVLDDPGDFGPAYLIGDRYADLGVFFDDDNVTGTYAAQAGGYAYVSVPVEAANAAGAGMKPITCGSLPCTIAFDPPVLRVGFHWSKTTYDNQSGRSEVVFYRDGVATASQDLIFRWDQLGFFGFEDPQGIDAIRVSDWVDLLRFAPEPERAPGAAAAVAALIAIAASSRLAASLRARTRRR